MKKTSIIIFMTFVLLYSCNVNKKITKTETENIKGVSLEANHITNNQFRLVYNSIDTIPTTLIINKKTIEKLKVRAVLDTIKMQNYNVNIDKKKRIIELISK